MASLNITSLVKHIDELRIWISNQSLDLLVINETRLNSAIRDSYISLEGYDLIRKDWNRIGGGVCLCIRDMVNFKTRFNLILEGLEAICVQVHNPKSKPFATVGCYRPPNSDNLFLENFESVIAKLDAQDREIFILGDLNCNYLTTNPNSYTTHLKNVSNVYQLSQIYKEPNRLTANSSSLIDIVLTNTPERLVRAGVIELSISDHKLINAIRKISVSQNIKQKVSIFHNFRHFNPVEFHSDLSKID